MIELHPEFLTKHGQKQFAVLPFLTKINGRSFYNLPKAKKHQKPTFFC